MKSIRSAFALPALLIAAQAAGNATTFTYDQTVNLNPASITSSGGVDSYSLQFTGNTPITVQAGDVITGTISFSGGPILLENPATSPNSTAVLLYFSQTTSAGPDTSESTTMQFQGLSGMYPNSNPVTLNSSGGPFAAGLIGSGSAYDFSFTGLTYTIDVNSVSNGASQVSAPFAFSQFSLQGQTIEFGATAPTPEPASFGICGIGLLALVYRRRRRTHA